MSRREDYERDGFVVVQSGLSGAVLEECKKARGPEQPKIYNYSGGHRFFESWKESQAIRDAVYSRVVNNAIMDITGATPRPFQTILFDRGSAQPLHADAVHFDTVPHGRIVGAWLALEDMDEDNGPLCYVPGSHRSPFHGWEAMGLKPCKVGEQEAEYRKYERICADADEWKVPFVCRKGDVFLWGVDMLHGGMPIRDEKRTRWSLVSHYFLLPMEYAFAPMFGTEKKPLRKSGRWFDRAGHLHPLERNDARGAK